jgi:TolB-like protein
MNVERTDVRAQIERIAGSAMFAESERLRRFLRFTVESTLGGDDGRLKEYVLGREVFDRKDGYDPRLDPIVRVEARRLRSKLSEYYSGPGRREAIRIAYPKGSYVPVFVPAEKTGSTAPPLWRISAILIALVALGLLAAYAYRSVSPARTSMVEVVPAQWLWPTEQGQDSSAIGLSEALDAQIADRGFARVVAWPIVAAHHNSLRSMGDTADRFAASQVIAVSTRRLDGGDLIAVFLIDVKSGEKLRAEHYFIRNAASYWIQKQLAARIADDQHRSGRL